MALVNKAAMNVGGLVAHADSDSNSSGYITCSETAGSYVVLFIIYWGCSMLFPKVDASFYIPTS